MVKKRPGERAQAILEFAVLTPIVFVFVFIIVDFGIGLAHHVALTNAAREGARYAAVGAPAYSGCNQASVVERIRCKTKAHAQNLVDNPGTQIQVAFLDKNSSGHLDRGDDVVVRINYSYKLITALGLSNPIGWLRWPGIPPLKMDSCEHMRVEEVTSDATLSTVNPCP